ncbi:MAG: LPXTG cell wall anchor domain-containing protein [Actinomycetota bacterium]|nr:LPXTG cell wall anchor domain-containing protein [Actinomycetota bacterium]
MPKTGGNGPTSLFALGAGGLLLAGGLLARRLAR